MRILFSLMMLSATTLFTGGCTTNMNYAVLYSRTNHSGITVEQIEFPNKYGEISGGAIMQYWLVDPNDPAKRKLLFTNERGADVVISPSKKWLFINNNDEEERELILLYRQKNGLNYEFVGDLTDGTWDFYAKQSGHPQPSDHYYVEVVCWANENTVLLRLNGNGEDSDVENWFCLYDISSKKFSTDLDRYNKQQFGIMFHTLGR
jgi:hypothetical protein